MTPTARAGAPIRRGSSRFLAWATSLPVTNMQPTTRRCTTRRWSHSMRPRPSASPVAQHYLLRMAAIPFGLLTVYAAYRATRSLFPGDAFLTVTVPALVAFQPQISYEAAMVNNDIVAIALTSLVLWGVIAGMRERFPLRLCAVLGVVLGLDLLAKGTAITVAPIIAAAVVLGPAGVIGAGCSRGGSLLAFRPFFSRRRGISFFTDVRGFQRAGSGRRAPVLEQLQWGRFLSC